MKSSLRAETMTQSQHRNVWKFVKRSTGLAALFTLAWFVPQHRGWGQGPAAPLKLWTEGDTLTAADLNGNFATLQAAQQPPLAWTAFSTGPWPYTKVQADGHVARFVFNSPVAGFVAVSAQFVANARNRFDEETPSDCSLEFGVGLSPVILGCDGGECTQSGYYRTFLTANTPTQAGAGTYLGLPQSLSNVVPIVAGTNTIFLSHRSDCREVLFHDITMTAVQVVGGQAASLNIP